MPNDLEMLRRAGHGVQLASVHPGPARHRGRGDRLERRRLPRRRCSTAVVLGLWRAAVSTARTGGPVMLREHGRPAPRPPAPPAPGDPARGRAIPSWPAPRPHPARNGVDDRDRRASGGPDRGAATPRRGAAADRDRAPAVATARGMSLFGEHAAGWLALGLLGALVDRARRRDWLTATAGVAVAHGASIAEPARGPPPSTSTTCARQALVGTPSSRGRLGCSTRPRTTTRVVGAAVRRACSAAGSPGCLAHGAVPAGPGSALPVRRGRRRPPGAGVAAAVPILERRLLPFFGRSPR